MLCYAKPCESIANEEERSLHIHYNQYLTFVSEDLSRLTVWRNDKKAAYTQNTLYAGCSHTKAPHLWFNLFLPLVRYQIFLHYITHYIPWHVAPSPVNPGLQVQVKLPTVLVQVASAPQPPLCVAHSSISAQSQTNWAKRFDRAMHNSAKRGIAIACRPSVRLWRWWIRTTSVGNLAN